MDVSKFHCTPSWGMHLNINRHECTQLYYAEWNENNKFRYNFRKSKNKVLNDCTDVFKRVNGEGPAYDQMFCIYDVWLDRSSYSAVLTSVIKNRYGKVSDQFLNGCDGGVWRRRNFSKARTCT